MRRLDYIDPRVRKRCDDLLRSITPQPHLVFFELYVPLYAGPTGHDTVMDILGNGEYRTENGNVTRHANWAYYGPDLFDPEHADLLLEILESKWARAARLLKGHTHA